MDSANNLPVAVIDTGPLGLAAKGHRHRPGAPHRAVLPAKPGGAINDTHKAVLQVTATDRASMDFVLDRAEKRLRDQAIKVRRGGILITRESMSSFSLEISDEVPFGFTVERQRWSQV
ncbi:hypothetical protein BJG92_03453 [Arthrobacter sp. SO5]|uniref:hypothetical protein n=1 Tax=Arthrobacter sp. SO5 TaxID=1897055 RepID=UPI001E40F8E3|nr:hypothetical protein [Arthrobacter sp. SO5]MCB5275899.1 hypothetical protein [Arthrobacter sp. SO5]